jgi:CRP-like cAMP-binding protein
VVDCLRRCSLFASLPDDLMVELAERAVARRYEPGQFLFRTGDPSESFFVLCSGHVRASVRSEQGREVVLHTAGPGEAPGYIDVVDDGPRSVDAIADDVAEVLILPAGAVRALLLAKPRVLMDLAADLVGIVRVLDRKVGEFVFLDLTARLARALLEMPSSHEVVRIDGTQSELADRLGVARQSLNRTLGELHERGLIRVSGAGSRIEIRDRDGLARLAGTS